MNHRVNNVQALYETAHALYNDVVLGGESSADGILDNLEQGINNLKNNWKGRDAGYRIQEVIKVHNAMVAVRNALASLAVESSKVAAKYREIQIANGSGDEALTTLTFDPEAQLGDYIDNNPGLDINPMANIGKNKIDTANNSIDVFINKVRVKYDELMANWSAGSGRNDLEMAFNSFVANANQYKQTLSDVSANIVKALGNYDAM